MKMLKNIGLGAEKCYEDMNLRHRHLPPELEERLHYMQRCNPRYASEAQISTAPALSMPGYVTHCRKQVDHRL